ncbi:topology modulation protein [Companilactobacillus huachuanensis]|uniref:Topology modulation protein n=1 Tax=Companilactobacillus huachuanensis TaxID=2559914 RepID=A0ABW1RPR8_9LACO|nr:topology modulation protein [Companilactobacillus huachuanensis]
MNIIIVGNSGTGKSTLSKKIARITDYPLMHLDVLWHTTDYSDTAKAWFIQRQQLFMNQKNWIIDGNYSGTMGLRISQADIIIWLKLNRTRALIRVLKRSLIFRLDKGSRLGMAEQFNEHLDRDYLDFLKNVLSYDEARIKGLIEQYKKAGAKVIVLTNSRSKRLFLKIFPT